MYLSPHFTLKELTRSALAMRHGIDNTPRLTSEIANLEQLTQNILQPVRNHFGVPFSPSSGYRCPRVNRLAGSSDKSQHVKGQAADFEVPGLANKDLADWIKDNLDFDQLILEFYNEADPAYGWIHCSYVKQGNRNQCLIFNGINYRSF